MGSAKGVLSSFVDGVCWVVDMGCTSEQVPKPSTSDQRGSQENRLADKVLGVELPSGQKNSSYESKKAKDELLPLQSTRLSDSVTGF